VSDDLSRCLVLPAERLSRRCASESLAFQTTEDLEPDRRRGRLIGQARAVKALRFGLGVNVEGYNIFVVGPTGTGKTTYARSLLGRLAAERPTPQDWCYVHNFKMPEQPNAVALPSGTAPRFKQDMERLIRALRVKIPEAFESEGYRKQQAQLRNEFQERTHQIMSRVDKAAKTKGFAIKAGPSGLTTIPLGPDGSPLSQEQFMTLDREERESVARNSRELQEEMARLLHEIRHLERQFRDRQETLDRKVVTYAIDPLFHELQERYGESEEIGRHLSDVRANIIENLDELKEAETAPRASRGGGSGPAAVPGVRAPAAVDPLQRYQVNVLVSQSGRGAPVVFETNPTYFNLGGKLEYRGGMGGLTTDFTMLSAGALHRANGGYLILNARDVLANPGSWELLKRSLLAREVRIENPSEQSRIIPTTGLTPEPIPLDVKVVMLGSREIYHLLYGLDPDFRKLFKVKAEFDREMPRTDRSEADYAAFVAGVVAARDLAPFDRAAVARVVDYGSRLAGSQEKLSLQFNALAEVVYEADAWSRARCDETGEPESAGDVGPGDARAGDAGSDGRPQAQVASSPDRRRRLVTEEDVRRAIEEKEYRSRLVAEKLGEMLEKGELLVDLEGRAVGQVNGLAVVDTGDYAFGKPSRLTAEVYMGSEGLINIEREARLSGKVHDKGVLILEGLIASRFAQDKPLSLSATLCFEQSYAAVDGDSASLAELVALLSGLAGVPVRQDIAVTGSVNQKGEVQPVGGVNEKIEGFFEVCRARELTGKQGVIIPARSAVRLMLRDEVVEAVREGRFHVWAVEKADEALELLTGMPAGKRGADGLYPEGTVNRLADEKLKEFARRLAELKGCT